MSECQSLSSVVRYRMTPEEIVAVHVARDYTAMARRYFPEYRHVCLPKRGDPRKCELFRYAWKMCRELEGRLGIDEYAFFVQAQFSVLKNIRKEGWHPLVHPNCLTGEQAWKRWSVWKRYFQEEKKTSEPAQAPPPPDFRYDLTCTKAALERRLGATSGLPVRGALDSGLLFRLCAAGVVSPHFLLYSPDARVYLSENQPDLGRYGITLPAWDREAEATYQQVFTS